MKLGNLSVEHRILEELEFWEGSDLEREIRKSFEKDSTESWGYETLLFKRENKKGIRIEDELCVIEDEILDEEHFWAIIRSV